MWREGSDQTSEGCRLHMVSLGMESREEAVEDMVTLKNVQVREELIVDLEEDKVHTVGEALGDMD